MPRRPRGGIAANAVLPTRLTPAEHATLNKAANGLGIEVSTLMRLSALDIARTFATAPAILTAAETRALTGAEVASLLGVLYAAAELLKRPNDRRRPMEDVTIQGYAQYEGYVVMPHDPTDAALVGQAVVRLCRHGYLERASTRPGVMASDLALQFGLPDRAIGVVPTGKRLP